MVTLSWIMTYLLCKVEILTKPDMPGGSSHKSGKLELDKQFGKEHTLSKNTWPDDQSVHHHKSTANFDSQINSLRALPPAEPDGKSNSYQSQWSRVKTSFNCDSLLISLTLIRFTRSRDVPNLLCKVHFYLSWLKSTWISDKINTVLASLDSVTVGLQNARLLFDCHVTCLQQKKKAYSIHCILICLVKVLDWWSS